MNLSLFSLIAKTMFTESSIRLPQGQVAVTKTPALGLRKVAFNDGSERFLAIQQNPATGSQWALEASKGHQVVQFKDAVTNSYVAVSVDGEVQAYPVKR